MSNQDPNNIGQQIKDSLAEGLKSGDFSHLTEVITDSANEAIKEAGKNMGMDFPGVKSFMDQKVNNYSSGAATRALQEEIERNHEKQRKLRAQKAKEEAELRARKQAARNRNSYSGTVVDANGHEIIPSGFKPVGEPAAKFLKVGGTIGFIFSTVAVAVRGLLLLLGVSAMSKFLFSAGLMVFFGYMMSKGASDVKIIETARRYAQICGNNMYAPISQIASSLGISEKKVVKDIKKILKKGHFPSGHIDTQATTLMLSDSVYNEYVRNTQRIIAEDEADREAKKSKEAEEAVAAAKKKAAYQSLSKEAQEELDAMIKEGTASIKKLHKLNDQIPGEAISAKLDRLEELLKEIFDRITEHPEQMNRIHKLMDYYLPTMLKLVEAYRDYDRVSEPGPEILDAKAEIEKTLDSINQAFVQLLNNLFQDSVWDVTTDAKVLKTMLAQEGLSEE